MHQKMYRDWKNNTNERQKLQWIFAVVALGMLVAAGLVGLVDQSLGLYLVNIAYIAALVWVINFVAWAIYLALNTSTEADSAPQSRGRSAKRK